MSITPPPPGMMITPLGQGTAKEYGLSSKAAMLDTAAARGIPVPDGVILLDEAHRAAVREVLVNTNDSRLITFLTLPDGLAKMTATGTKVAIRAAFSEPSATPIEAQLNIDPRDTGALAEALRTVWNAGAALSATARHDVLIMEMITPVRSGIAYTEIDYEDDMVIFSAAEDEQRRAMPKLRRWEDSDQAENWLARLQAILRDARRIFGAANWEVHFADDGNTCWVLDLSAMTTAPSRADLYVPAEPDYLPKAPSRLTSSILESVAPKLSEVYQAADPASLNKRPLLKVVNGAPQFNLSLMVDLMRGWGLATENITLLYGGDMGRTARGWKLNLARALSRPNVLANLGVTQVFATARAQEAYRDMLEKTEPAAIGDTFKAVITTARDVYTTFYSALLTMNAAVAGREPDQIMAARPTPDGLTHDMLTDLVPLRALVNAPEVRDALTQGKLPDQAAFVAAWRSFIAKHGHRAHNEDDLASTRFYEDPRPIYAALLAPTAPTREVGKISAARENLRYQAMYALERLRNKFLALTDQAVAQGKLTHRDQVWTHTTEELIALDGS